MVVTGVEAASPIQKEDGESAYKNQDNRLRLRKKNLVDEALPPQVA